MKLLLSTAAIVSLCAVNCPAVASDGGATLLTPGLRDSRHDVVESESRQDTAASTSHERRGDAFMLLRKYSDALNEYKQCSGAPYGLGDAYAKLGQLQAAGTAYAQAGRDVDAAGAFFKAGDFAAAAASYDAEWQKPNGIFDLAGRSDIRDFDALHHNHARHADALYQTGQLERAAKEFHKVVAAFKPQPSVIRAVGRGCKRVLTTLDDWNYKTHVQLVQIVN